MESLQAGTNIQAQHLRRDQGWQNKWSSLLATKENSACVYLVTLTTQQRLQFLSTSTALEVKGLKERREKGPCEWISCQLLAHQVVLGFGHIWIIWAQPGLVDLQGTTVVIFHLLIFALILTQQGQVVQLFGHIWMICTENLRRRQKKRCTVRDDQPVTLSITLPVCDTGDACSLSSVTSKDRGHI